MLVLENHQGRKSKYATEEERKEARKAYNRKVMKENIWAMRLALHKVHDAYLIAWLQSQENKQGYIKQLIVDDINRKNGEIE